MKIGKTILLLAVVGLLLSGAGTVQADERPDCADRYTPATHDGEIFDVTDNCAHDFQDATDRHEGKAPDSTGSWRLQITIYPSPIVFYCTQGCEIYRSVRELYSLGHHMFTDQVDLRPVVLSNKALLNPQRATGFIVW